MSSEDNHAHLPRSKKGGERKVSPSDKHRRTFTYFCGWPKKFAILEMVLFIPNELRTLGGRERPDPDQQYPTYSTEYAIKQYNQFESGEGPASQNGLCYRSHQPRIIGEGETEILWPLVPCALENIHLVHVGIRLDPSVAFSLGSLHADHTLHEEAGPDAPPTVTLSYRLGDLLNRSGAEKVRHAQMFAPLPQTWVVQVNAWSNSPPSTSCVAMFTSQGRGVSRRRRSAE